MERADRSRQAARFESANDRLKARWTRWVGGSTVLAGVVHVGLLALISWQTVHPDASTSSFDGRALALLPPSGEGGPAGDAPRPPIPAETLEEPVTPGSDEERGSGIEALDGDLWAALSERLRERGPMRPTLAEAALEAEDPEPDPDAAIESAGDGEDPDVDAIEVGIDLTLLPETDALDLDRLAALEPELAVAAPSAWVLIRNPLEVEEFLRSGYAWGRLDPRATGSVSVTLWIDERGSVEWAEISESSGDRELDEFALAVFNEVAVFRPAREEGVRVSRSVSFALNFPW